MLNADDKNPADNRGVTPLHKAAESGHLEICRLITEHVPDKNLVIISGPTPLDLAKLNNHADVCKLFLDKLDLAASP